MSELVNARNRAVGFRTCLLANVSSLALLGWAGVAASALAASADEDHPTIWIELGGQFERADNAPQLFSPPFFSKASPADLAVLTGPQRPPPYSTGFDGKISFEPENSDWVFSGAARFGKSGTIKHLHHQTAGRPSAYITLGGQYDRLPRAIYADTHSGYSESHTILDFQAGKDIGLGMFGAHGDSVISAGVRFAHFTADSHATFHALPIYNLGPRRVVNPGELTIRTDFRASYSGNVHSSRNAHAVGPSLSWDASLPVTGNDSGMTLNVDWGINGAVLFGRQRARVHHQTSGHYVNGLLSSVKYQRSYANPAFDRYRSRTVTIPNAGGFAGASLRFPHAKVSLGYRADFFFGGMDGGIDTARKENVGFYGPFASISVGLGG